jgi:CII-binding regulator of phage lambda lysogenization HflD
VASYKPGPQARYLVDKMMESEKSIHEALSRLTSQLVTIERKVDSNTTDLGQVREKVDLVMTTISVLSRRNRFRWRIS